VSNKDHNFDNLAKGLAEGRVTRGRALKTFGAAIFGGALTALIPGVAFAAPRTCATCTCGVGRPCNPRQEFCVEVGRGFPTASDQCSARCTQAGFKFCGAGNQFHCPQGCPA
jgi:hypothetical protein